MNKRKWWPLVGIALSLLAIIVAAFALHAATGGSLFTTGVQHVEVVERNSGRKTIFIAYGFGTSDHASYSIRVMDQGEKVFLGERLVEDDGLLGKYRMEVMFHDIKGSPALAKESPLGKVHELIDASSRLKSEYRIRIAYPPDDSSFVIYIGSDEPLNVDEVEYARLSPFGGRIAIPLD
jgi:hypothetical protein